MKTGNVIQYLGICTIMISLLYMIMNLSDADYFITEWLLFMLAGISISFWGTICLMIKKKRNKDN